MAFVAGLFFPPLLLLLLIPFALAVAEDPKGYFFEISAIVILVGIIWLLRWLNDLLSEPYWNLMRWLGFA